MIVKLFPLNRAIIKKMGCKRQLLVIRKLFKTMKQLLLIAYEIVGATLFLYTMGSHENFYRELKTYLKH